MICPMIIFGTIGFYSFCLDQQPTYQFNDCWESQNYATSIAFEVEISPTYIEVNSDFAYTNCPMCNVWSNAIITDGCNGDIVWSSEGCGQDLVVNSYTEFGGFDIIPNLAGENWWVELDPTCWKLRHAHGSDRHKRRRTVYDRLHGRDYYFGAAWIGSGGVSNEDDSWG
jgi:hypothetical protein